MRAPNAPRSLAAPALLAVLLAACGSSASYEVSAALRRGELDLAQRLYDAQGGRDLASLRAIAAAVLEREAASADEAARERAFAALRASGTAAEPSLERLLASADEPVRARALALLAQLGDGAARAELRALLSRPELAPEVEAAALSALDPARDAARLGAALDSIAPAVRRAAALRLVQAPPHPSTFDALSRAVRHDPDSAVRFAALRALAGQGPPGLAAVEQRLQDADPELRAAAVATLASADPARARAVLARLLAEPSPEAIAGARAAIASDAPNAAAARELLARALRADDPALRGRAAVALMSLRDPALAELAAARARHEPARGIRLCLVLSLPSEHPARTALLAPLMQAADATAAQAAAELAAQGDPAALARLRELLGAGDGAVRRTAARALAADLGRAHEARGALRDADASVRVTAAAAILIAAARA